MSKIMDFLFGPVDYETYYDDEQYIQIQRIVDDNEVEEEQPEEFQGFEKTNFGVAVFNEAMLFYIIGDNVSRQQYSND